MRIRSRVVLFLSALLATFGMMSAVALAMPGDLGISQPAPVFRLHKATLEPGAFALSQAGMWIQSDAGVGIDASSFDAAILPNGELRLANNTHHTMFSMDIDQVLVPAEHGGYAVYNTFDVGNNESAASIAPGEVGSEMIAPGGDKIVLGDVIVVLSDEKTLIQNEPYVQQAGGMVSAINRPIIAPKVTALGVSAFLPLHTYKVGFGYTVEKWYTAPVFDGHGLFPAVTDPETGFHPFAAIPASVRILPRLGDLPYDARRVNDVDKAGESWTHGSEYDGQDIFLSQTGNLTAWTDKGGNGLLTTLTQGDLPITWQLRPSLAAPASLRSAALTDDMLRAWEASWQAYYIGKGPKPTMPLAPGTNSPAPATSVVVNLPETKPATGPQSQVAVRIVSQRVVKIKFSKKVAKAFVRVNGRKFVAHRRAGRLVARVSLKGLMGYKGDYVTAVLRYKHQTGGWHQQIRMLAL